MAGFLYVIGGVQPSRVMTVDKMQALGLGYAFGPGCAVAYAGMHSGPGGLQGCLLGNDNNFTDRRVAYKPDAQTWRKIPALVDAEDKPVDAWVGFYNDARPGPVELARENIIAGPDIKLRDERFWTAPIAVTPADQPSGGWLPAYVLPSKMDLDEAGRFVRSGVEDRYEWLLDLAMGWFDDRVALEKANLGLIQESELNPDAFDDERIYGDAVRALSANYRIGRAEVVALGLLDLPACASILDTLIDYRNILAWGRDQKKTGVTDTDGSGSSDGQPVEPLATAQP